MVAGFVTSVALAVTMVSAGPGAAVAGGSAPSLELHPGLVFVVGTRLSDAGPAPTVRATVTWDRGDPSGICAQRVRVRDRDDPDARTRTVRVRTRARHVGLDLVVDREYRVTVKVTGCDGGVSRASGSYSARLVQETGPESYLDPDSTPWTVFERRWASGGTVALGREGGQAVLFVSVRSVALVGARAPRLGTAWIGGSFARVDTVDFSGPRTSRIVLYADRWGTLSPGSGPVLDLIPQGPVALDAWLLG